MFFLNGIAAVMLLVVLLYSNMGYIVVHRVMVENVQSDVKKIIVSGVKENDLVVLTLPHEGTTRHEIRLGTKMYDVVRTQECGDSTKYFCLEDSKEEKLFTALETAIDEYLNQHPEKSKEHRDIVSTLKIDFFISYHGVLPTPANGNTNYRSLYTLMPAASGTEIPTPPPKAIS